MSKFDVTKIDWWKSEKPLVLLYSINFIAMLMMIFYQNISSGVITELQNANLSADSSQIQYVLNELIAPFGEITAILGDLGVILLLLSTLLLLVRLRVTQKITTRTLSIMLMALVMLVIYVSMKGVTHILIG